jgi:uncharacterized protein (TIGR00251 family)
MPPVAWIREVAGGVILSVRLQPRAARNEIVGPHGDSLKIKVTAPPVDSAANEALVQLLADRLDLARNRIELVRGHTSRQKSVHLTGLTALQVEARLTGSGRA